MSCSVAGNEAVAPATPTLGLPFPFPCFPGQFRYCLSKREAGDRGWRAPVLLQRARGQRQGVVEVFAESALPRRRPHLRPARRADEQCPHLRRACHSAATHVLTTHLPAKSLRTHMKVVALRCEISKLPTVLALPL